MKQRKPEGRLKYRIFDIFVFICCTLNLWNMLQDYPDLDSFDYVYAFGLMAVILWLLARWTIEFRKARSGQEDFDVE